jgi:hypothetical protein
MFTLTELFSQEQFLPHPLGPFKLYLGVFTLTDFKNQMRPFQSSKQLLACALFNQVSKFEHAPFSIKLATLSNL